MYSIHAGVNATQQHGLKCFLSPLLPTPAPCDDRQTESPFPPDQLSPAVSKENRAQNNPPRAFRPPNRPAFAAKFEAEDHDRSLALCPYIQHLVHLHLIRLNPPIGFRLIPRPSPSNLTNHCTLHALRCFQPSPASTSCGSISDRHINEQPEHRRLEPVGRSQLPIPVRQKNPHVSKEPNFSHQRHATKCRVKGRE